MSSPRQEKHKCSLFEEEIPAITYNSGGTYTLGALLEVSSHHLQQWGHLNSGSATRGKQASLTTVRAPTTVGAPTVHSFSPSSVQ